jgi:hypothetical protein
MQSVHGWAAGAEGRRVTDLFPTGPRRIAKRPAKDRRARFPVVRPARTPEPGVCYENPTRIPACAAIDALAVSGETMHLDRAALISKCQLEVYAERMEDQRLECETCIPFVLPRQRRRSGPVAGRVDCGGAEGLVGPGDPAGRGLEAGDPHGHEKQLGRRALPVAGSPAARDHRNLPRGARCDHDLPPAPARRSVSDPGAIERLRDPADRTRRHPLP